MTGVRNGILLRELLEVTDWTELATVESNETWLIKGVHWLCGAEASTIVQVAVLEPGRVLQHRFARFEIAAGGDEAWSGWTAAGPGDHIWAISSGGPAQLVLVGAALPGSIGAP